MVSRLEQLAPWCAGAVIAAPVLLARYPPMADLPLHEAVVGLLRHWGDPAYIPANVYELNFGQPNQLVHFLILGLAYVFPIGTATKLVVALTLLFLPPILARFADYLGVTRWTAVLLAPLGLGWMFFWGLLANLIGFDLYFAALPSLDRLCERPTWRAVGVACAWVVLLHFAHDFMALVAGGTIVLFTLCSWRGWRKGLLRIAPAALIVTLAVASRALDARHLAAHARALPDFRLALVRAQAHHGAGGPLRRLRALGEGPHLLCVRHPDGPLRPRTMEDEDPARANLAGVPARLPLRDPLRVAHRRLLRRPGEHELDDAHLPPLHAPRLGHPHRDARRATASPSAGKPRLSQRRARGRRARGSVAAAAVARGVDAHRPDSHLVAALRRRRPALQGSRFCNRAHGQEQHVHRARARARQRTTGSSAP